MNRWNFVLKSRGIRNSVERAVAVGSRFGFRDADFLERLEYFANVVGEFGIQPSFPISTILIERYPNLATRLRRVNAEFLSHGHTHVDYTFLNRAEQQRLIRKSCDALSSSGLAPVGFRAPYLHWNDPLLQVVADAGFQFDSSAVTWWPLPSSVAFSRDQEMAYHRAQRFYKPYLAHGQALGIPYMRKEGLLEIPVSLPDDEILIDRLHVTDPQQLAHIWLGMFEASYAAGGLLNLQIHPERIFLMEKALKSLLHNASLRTPSVWIANLKDVYGWWKTMPAAMPTPLWPNGCRSALCVSGDIDCATVQDFLWRFVEKA